MDNSNTFQFFKANINHKVHDDLRLFLRICRRVPDASHISLTLTMSFDDYDIKTLEKMYPENFKPQNIKNIKTSMQFDLENDSLRFICMLNENVVTHLTMNYLYQNYTPQTRNKKTTVRLNIAELLDVMMRVQISSDLNITFDSDKGLMILSYEDTTSMLANTKISSHLSSVIIPASFKTIMDVSGLNWTLFTSTIERCNRIRDNSLVATTNGNERHRSSLYTTPDCNLKFLQRIHQDMTMYYLVFAAKMDQLVDITVDLTCNATLHDIGICIYQKIMLNKMINDRIERLTHDSIIENGLVTELDAKTRSLLYRNTMKREFQDIMENHRATVKSECIELIEQGHVLSGNYEITVPLNMRLLRCLSVLSKSITQLNSRVSLVQNNYTGLKNLLIKNSPESGCRFAFLFNEMISMNDGDFDDDDDDDDDDE